MSEILIHSLNEHVGKMVTLKGFIEKIRDQKHVQFVILRNRSGMVQLVNEKSKNPELAECISQLTLESSVCITGEVVANEHAKLGGVEILLSDMNIYSKANTPLPIEADSNLDVRMDWRFLDLRQPEKRLIFEVQTVAEHAMRKFWTSRDFIEIHSPKMMGTASESGAELFKIQYFDREAYLAQSPQFYKQMAIAAGFERVFEIGPVFRANPSFTSRHDTEFTSVDAEIAWIDSHEDVMKLEETWLHHIISEVKEKLGDRIKETYDIDIKVPTLPFPRMTMSEAHAVLRERGHDLPEDTDLDTEGEKMLGQYIAETFNHDFVFVTDYPSTVRPFYHMRFDDNPKVTKSFDLLWNGLEVTSGAQREHRYDVLLKQAAEKGLNPEPIQSYLSCFQYGCPPHGGFGFGLSRMLMLLLGFKNVRETTYLYRGPHRLTP